MNAYTHLCAEVGACGPDGLRGGAAVDLSVSGAVGHWWTIIICENSEMPATSIALYEMTTTYLEVQLVRWVTAQLITLLVLPLMWLTVGTTPFLLKCSSVSGSTTSSQVSSPPLFMNATTSACLIPSMFTPFTWRKGRWEIFKVPLVLVLC